MPNWTPWEAEPQYGPGGAREGETLYSETHVEIGPDGTRSGFEGYFVRVDPEPRGFFRVVFGGIGYATWHAGGFADQTEAREFAEKHRDDPRYYRSRD